jgi:hypothetical protein
MRRTQTTAPGISDVHRGDRATFRRFRRIGSDAYRKQYWSRPADDVVNELTIIVDRLAP